MAMMDETLFGPAPPCVHVYTRSQAGPLCRKCGHRPGIDGPAPYVRSSDTSAMAAESMKGAAGTIARKVYDCIAAARDGKTTDEVEVQLDGRHQTISARVNQLAKAGLIVDSGRRRPTRSGRNAAVYVACVVTTTPDDVA